MAKQNSKEEQHINVYVRIRPNNAEYGNKSSNLDVLSKKEILCKNTYNQKRYVFDRVFDSHSSQQEIFNSIVSPLIPEVIGGYNCTVFAYGQTGTGKTYTMEGIHDRDNQINAGIIPRSLGQIFKVLSIMNTESSVKVSYLELYNEELFDLLSQSNMPKAIRIFEDKAQKGSVILQGLEELSVTELNQVFKILEQGSERRRIASTLLNSCSSRSHTVFTIVVHTREITVDGEELVKTGKLNLVDLAGSENISKSGAIDKRAREAGNINQSLLTLGRVIKALTEKNTHVPYRESKLTRILQDSLGGRTKTSLIATISSENVHIEETINTLEYAMRARCIQNRPELNQKISRTALINQYSDTIEKLQKEVAAMRTGNGFFVDQYNYTKLVSDHEAQKAEITEKLGYIKKLETDISDNMDKLHTLQTSWTEAANNIEYLSNEKKILEKDLILVKEVNEQQIRELQEFRNKNKHLTDETEKLLFDMQKHSVNEDTLHRKVSYLYQTSQSNRSIADSFYNTYNKSYMKLISRIEQCINYTLQSVLNVELFVKDEPREIVYTNILSEINNLLQFSNDQREYKLRYFRNKAVLETRYASYYTSLESLVDSMHERTMKFSNKFDDSLIRLRDLIRNFSCRQDTDLKIIIPTLFNIRETVAVEFEMMSNILGKFHSLLMNDTDDLLAQIKALEEENTKSHEIIAALQEKLNTRYDTLLKDVSDMKEMCKTDFSNYESRQCKVRSHCSELSNQIQSLKESSETNTTALIDKNYNTWDTLQNLVVGATSSLDEITNNVQLEKHQIAESVSTHISDADDMKRIITNGFEEYKTTLSNCRSEVHTLEAVDDEHYRALEKIIGNVSDATKCIEENTIMAANQQTELKKKIDDTVQETASVLKDTRVFCVNHSNHLKDLLDEFCGCKLQYPTHAGDTPQKVQPKSSLYIQTLSKNCFKSTSDNGKKVHYTEVVNKENSSATLNAIYTTENDVDT